MNATSASTNPNEPRDAADLGANPKFRRAIVPVDSIVIEETFGRELDDEHVQALAEIIEHYGNRYPPIVSEGMELLAGHPQLAAVQRLGHRMMEVVIEVTHQFPHRMACSAPPGAS